MEHVLIDIVLKISALGYSYQRERVIRGLENIRDLNMENNQKKECFFFDFLAF